MLAKALAQGGRSNPWVAAGAEDEQVDARGRLKNQRQRLRRDGLRVRDRPGPNSVRQAKERTAMRQSGEAEAAIPIGIDRAG
jgi:hypothetical protein